MKRSNSEQSSSDIEDYKPQIQLPVTPKKAKSQVKSTSTTPEKKARKEKEGGGQVNGTWTSEKKAKFMDVIISNGYKATNLDVLNIEVRREVSGLSGWRVQSLIIQLGMSKRQLIDQLVPNKKGTCREKAVEAIRGQK